MCDVSINYGGNGGNNVLNYDYNVFQKNNYTIKPLTFSGYSTEFEWQKIKM